MFEIPLEIELMYVKVIKIGLKIEELSVLDGNFGNKLKYTDRKPMKTTTNT